MTAVNETESASIASKQTENTLSPTTNKEIVTPSMNIFSDTSALLPEGIEPLEDLTPENSSNIDIHQVIDEVAGLYQKHCAMKPEEVDANTLWVISTYLINSFRIFPKLAFISPERRCGKSTTMELTDSLVRDGVLSSNLSPAVLYRTGATHQPTLLIDEADTYIKNGERELIGIINSSHTRASAFVVRCAGEDHTPTKFSTWMPMALASIGTLPDTIMDRSIVINLRRKKASDVIEKLPVETKDTNKPLRQKLARWCLDNKGAVKNSKSEPPHIGNDRAADNWTPLYKIADVIGGEWPNRCEAAYRKLTTMDELDTPTQLLSDIRDILDDHNDSKIPSGSLLDKLLEDRTKPWHDFDNGRKLSPHKMANLLKPYGISTQSQRFDTKVLRGYSKDQFTDTFERYLPSST